MFEEQARLGPALLLSGAFCSYFLCLKKNFSSVLPEGLVFRRKTEVSAVSPGLCQICLFTTEILKSRVCCRRRMKAGKSFFEGGKGKTSKKYNSSFRRRFYLFLGGNLFMLGGNVLVLSVKALKLGGNVLVLVEVGRICPFFGGFVRNFGRLYLFTAKNIARALVQLPIMPLAIYPIYKKSAYLKEFRLFTIR